MNMFDKSVYNWKKSVKPNVFECTVRLENYDESYFLKIEKIEENVWWWSIASKTGEQLKNSYTEKKWGYNKMNAKNMAENTLVVFTEELKSNN